MFAVCLIVILALLGSDFKGNVQAGDAQGCPALAGVLKHLILLPPKWPLPHCQVCAIVHVNLFKRRLNKMLKLCNNTSTAFLRVVTLGRTPTLHNIVDYNFTKTSCK